MTTVEALETPAVVVDLNRLELNLGRVATYASEHALELHPHTKTHKTVEIARLQLGAGASGLTVAKSSEAELFAEAGLGPLLLHYPVVGAAKLERVVAAAERMPLTIALDSYAVAEPLATTLAERGVVAEVLVEVDVGMRRTGLDPRAAVELAERIERLGGSLLVAGLSCYPGHLRSPDGLAEVDALLAEAQEAFDAAGLRCERISGGSTATLFGSHETRMTELRPGNYALLDRSEARGEFGLDDCALRVHATVVSTSVPGRVVLDAGSKTLSEAGPPPGLDGFGEVVDHPELTLDALNEEHAYGTLAAGVEPPRVGDRLELIPNHACTCVNLHDTIFGVRGGSVELELRVAGRGAVR